MKNDRRKFLKEIGILSVGAGLVSPVASLAENNKQAKSNPVAADTNNEKFVLNILHTTDVHCQVHPHDELFWENEKSVFRKTGGYAHLATYLKEERKKNSNTFLIDTGDMFQGSELSIKTSGEAIAPILNALNYDLYIPGNWEVIYYKKAMQKLLGSLHAPKICTNMYHDLGEGKKGELIFQPYEIWEVQGVKIGFLAYTDPLVPLRQSPSYSKGIIYRHPEENIVHYIDVLRNQEQCAFVIVLSHLGLSQQIHLSNQEICKGVDYILGGDTHERIRKPIVGKYAKVVEPGAFGSFVGKLQLTIENGKVIKDEYELVEVESDKLKPDAEIAGLIAAGEQPFKEDIYKVVGYSKVPLYRYFVIENTIDTLILDALRLSVPEVDIVLSNGFRFCPPRVTPDQTGNIPITNGFIFDMLPVDSVVRTGEVSGQQILDWLEKELNNVFAQNAKERFGGWMIKFSGMKIKFYAFGENGKRVKEAKIGGVLLDPAKTYKICACERDGDPVDMLCRIRGVKNAKNTSLTLHGVMKNHLKKNSPVNPVIPNSAVALDAPGTLLTQVWGVDYQFK
jgi:S-sulfosulfanyl-L-cysteine sulfohydrolase